MPCVRLVQRPTQPHESFFILMTADFISGQAGRRTGLPSTGPRPRGGSPYPSPELSHSSPGPPAASRSKGQGWRFCWHYRAFPAPARGTYGYELRWRAKGPGQLWRDGSRVFSGATVHHVSDISFGIALAGCHYLSLVIVKREPRRVPGLFSQILVTPRCTDSLFQPVGKKGQIRRGLGVSR